MANPYLQKARQRKFTYLALILVLFTGSLMHRRFVVEPEAERLKLRETVKGEVELTSSAVRHLLTGSRGLAVTFLWNAALKQQEKHEWNELELLVGAITKLQPYFITPWLFQGWNLAYNVAVECDMPRDKYYYVSRGLKLLAEGERRNEEQGVGQPDLRHFIGIAYQGKIGTSDEKNAMRCLFDMSCMDPVQRDPERFWTIVDGRRTVNLTELAKLCREHPRLVRRLREKLGYTEPKQIVDFLENNQDVPSRYERLVGYADQRETPLKSDYREQFPILPPPSANLAPNPATADFGLGQENMDIFLTCRAWYEYAQAPLPPPVPDASYDESSNFDRQKHRLPKAPALPIFRCYPARAQEYVAEVLTEEGWFDEDGWLVRHWFDDTGLEYDGEFRVGTEYKYHSGPAWERTYQLYKEVGANIGLYFSPSEMRELEQQAQLFRKTFNVREGQPGPTTLRGEQRNDQALQASMRAHQKLHWRAAVTAMANYDGHLTTAQAEKTPMAVYGRKLLFHADYLRRIEHDPERSLAAYADAWPIWLGIFARHPVYASQLTQQDDFYELHIRYLMRMQNQRSTQLKAVTLGLAQTALWPPAPLDELLASGDQSRILPIRTVQGPFDWARMYHTPVHHELSRFLTAWTHAAGVVRPLPFPGIEDYALVALEHRDTPLERGWQHVFNDGNIMQVKVRLGLIKMETPESEEASE